MKVLGISMTKVIHHHRLWVIPIEILGSQKRIFLLFVLCSEKMTIVNGNVIIFVPRISKLQYIDPKLSLPVPI
jgi:hypothetical protein